MLPVVIVDDSREDLALGLRIFKQCKILNPVHGFISGRECIEFLEGKGAFANRKLPCLLLVDLVMSPITGVDVLRHVAENRAAKGSVSIMLSGLQDVRAIKEGYQLGAATFFLKPLRSEDLPAMLAAVRGIYIERLAEGLTLSVLETERASKRNREELGLGAGAVSSGG